MRIYGVDFTSAPNRRKPLTVAVGNLRDAVLTVERVDRLESFDAFEKFLRTPGPWVGGFDFPFGLPREAVTDLKMPSDWRSLAWKCREWGKAEFKARLDQYRESRAFGKRYATRAGDSASGAHPAVKLVNPPVGLMFFEGAPRLADAGLTIPFLSSGDSSRVALEAYPGMLIRKHLSIDDPYKNDQRRKQTPEHRKVRVSILKSMKAGKPHGIRLQTDAKVELEMIEDGSGDTLDAAICAVQASWGQRRGPPGYGLPSKVDPVEGWIVGA